MNRILIAAAVVVMASGSALAADLPYRVAPPVYAPAPLPVFTWTGAYIGVNAGYAFNAETRVTARDSFGNVAGVAGGFGPTGFRSTADGFTGGGQVGYNLQLPGLGGFGPGGGIVVGVEADAAYTDLNRGTTASLGNFSGTYRTGLDYLGTVRGRVGYAFNQFLIYGTGGFAYGGVNDRASFFAGNTLRYAGHNDDMATGFVYGGGVEYALPTGSFLNFFKASAVTLKAEYLHYDLGSSNVSAAATFANAAPASYNVRFKNEGDIVRAGLNYKFGSF